MPLVRLLVVFALLVPLHAGADRAPVLYPGIVRKQYTRLVRSGCNLHEHQVRFPLEARVLRNIPFAIAGRRFHSAGLTALFSSDGGWYKPVTDHVTLRPVDRRCVAKLAALEKRLRKELPMSKPVETMLVGSRVIFIHMRQLSRSSGKTRMIDASSSVDEEGWHWSVTQCDPGVHDTDECGSYGFTCKPKKGTKGFSHLECEMMSYG